MTRVHKARILAGIAVLALLGTASADLIDAVVATVDKEVILYSEIFADIQPELENIRASATSQQDLQRRTNEIVNQALEEAIETRILVREARKLSVEVSDDDVESRIDLARDSYDSEEAFIRDLQELGETLSSFRDRKRKQIMAQRLAFSKLHVLEEEIVVSDADIAQFYEDNKPLFQRPERARVHQIFLRVDRDTIERNKARARLELLKEEIESGAKFADLARIHSQAPGAETGGIIGWQERGDLIPPLEDAAFALPIGRLSDIVETPGGLHLLMVDARQEAGIAPLDEVRLDIEPKLRADAAQKRYETWLTDLRKRSRVRTFL